MKIAFALTLAVYGMFTPFSSRAADKTPEQIVQEARAQVKEVSLREVKKMMDSGEKIVILDVRDKEEYEKEHITGAINISRGLLEFLVQNKIPDKNTTIIVY
ncbi:MAG: rhodanese-like domain-containing protein [Nitrospiraceae bacterium]|nr:MAG: rhodanese-like domain-containing protein [Nitrospiraceae bacterium]